MISVITPVVVGLIRKNKRYLMTKRTHNDQRFHDKWQFPGGGLEFGENIIDCLRRELKEELDVTIKKFRRIPILFEVIRNDWHGLIIPYLCSIDSEAKINLLDDEASEYSWFNKEEILNLSTLLKSKEMLLEAEKIGAGERS